MDSADLSAFKNRGGKILTWHGLADELVVPQGTVNYYNRVAAQMGGIANVQSFYRLYLVPGLGHSTSNGTSNPEAAIPNFSSDQMYSMLTDWVEKALSPTRRLCGQPTGRRHEAYLRLTGVIAGILSTRYPCGDLGMPNSGRRSTRRRAARAGHPGSVRQTKSSTSSTVLRGFCGQFFSPGYPTVTSMTGTSLALKKLRRLAAH
ncbi:tannase/feruloyl esterase family alpha/beta hydrolase [Cupriavidus sp. UYPR2.512]|uniref:tannase/feruloyl esterase family alpha/beta hydrolase n=1 Tax=Cupriavidus sp. UYPR2.512 TaxID=1080187 RepID=UPI001E450987|nr:tannase/feruloyl esterase family alpha/beta hydrolase [Cupriavidus sp. UYPR2.512]